MTTELKNHPEMRRDDICDKINERIADLGLEGTETNCYGLVCYDDTGIEGDYFRIDGDNSGAVEIDGPATIKSLEEVGYTGDFETDRDNFYAALVEFKSEDTE